MNRRTLLGRLGAIAAAVAVAPAAQAEAVVDEDAQIRALVDDALANPDKYPDLWARVRELTGDAESFEVTNDMLKAIAEMSRITGEIHGYNRAKHEAKAEIEAAYREGYARREYVEAMRAESRAMRGFRTVPIGEPHEAMRVPVVPDFTELLHHNGRRGLHA